MSYRKIGTLLITMLVIGSLSVVTGCASPRIYQMDSGERTAGAEGELTITTDDNGNQLLNLTVAHLPLPSRLEESMATYVVWVQPEDSSTSYNMGQIRLSDARTGELNFTSPFPAFSLMVTAEVEPTVYAPSNQVVLRRQVTPSR